MKKLMFLTAVMFMITSASKAQTTIKGKVTNNRDGNPLFGAVIKAKEKADLLVKTDVQGNYTIVVPAEVKNLYVSYKGLKSQVIKISNRSTINVGLSASSSSLKKITKSASKKENRVAD
jgi:hypothetical protein